MMVALKRDLKQWEIGPLHIIAFLTLLQLFITLLTDGFALSFDEAIWQYIGRNWFRHGLVPYAGGVDNKSPLMFAIYGLSDHLFGVNYWFSRVLGTICQSVGIYYVYKIALHLSHRKTALLAISLYGLSLLWHVTSGKYVSYTETYEMTFVIISVYYALTAENKTGLFIGGAMAGIGLAFRISAFFAILAVLVYLVRKSFNGSVVFCLGIISSATILLLTAYLSGIHLSDLYTYSFADNFNSGSPYHHSFLWKMEQFSDKFLYSELVLLYPLAIAYGLIVKRVDLFVLWLIFAFMAIVFIGEFPREHLKELLPAFALINAFALGHLTDVYGLPFKAIMLVTWIVFFPKLMEPLLNLKSLLSHRADTGVETCTQPYTWPDEGNRKKLGWWVRDHTTDQQKVFVAGFGAQIQAYSERRSVYFNEMQTPLANQKLFKDLEVNKPDMILMPLYPQYQAYIGPEVRNFVDSLVAGHYQLYNCLFSYHVYKLKQP